MTMKERLIINPLYRDVVRFIETSAETEGQHSLFEVTLMPGGATPPHFHTSFSESFTALKGVLGIRLKNEKILLTPGETYQVLKNEIHNFYNPGKTPITF
jgi:quercetin dioxygenase-like cupin family protein